MSNPFHLVYDALWRMAERNHRLADLIPMRNRIKYEENVDKLQNYNDGDLPELELISAGARKWPQSTNCTTYLTKKYIWAVITGTLEVEAYNGISWELFRSMEDWKCVLCQLEWCNCTFVHNFRLIEAEEGNEMLAKEVGIDGWAAFWTVEVDLQFSVTALKV